MQLIMISFGYDIIKLDEGKIPRKIESKVSSDK